MPNSASGASAALARKEAKRRRFFAAIATNQDQVKHPMPGSTETTAKQPQGGQSGSSAGASSSGAASSSPSLSKEAEEKLEAFYRDSLRARGGFDNFAIPDRERRKYLRESVATISTVPPAQLSGEMAMMQRKLLSVKSALNDLDNTPYAQLPPHFQEMKRSMREYMSNDPFDPRRVEARMNGALRAAGEPELTLPYSHWTDFRQDPPVQVRNEAVPDLDEAVRQANAQLQDLVERKPEVYAVVIGFYKEFVAHDNKARECERD